MERSRLGFGHYLLAGSHLSPILAPEDLARTVDTVGRLGGDEFVVLLEHTGGPGATAALARLRRGMQGGWHDVAGQEVGASMGITTYRAGDSVATLLARADAEMYADKARRAGVR